MKKLVFVKSLLSILSLSYIGCLAAAVPSQQDPLQSYRNEIKEAENNASQSMLEQLQAEPNPDNSDDYAHKSITNPQSPAQPPSNQERAFKLPDTAKNPSISANNSNNTNNPWIKPNPWENTAKVNPWVNAPIDPAPTLSTNTLSSPPNIFAPSQKQTQLSNKS